MDLCLSVCNCRSQKSFSDLLTKENIKQVWRIVEKVSVVALGVLAAMTAPHFFVPAFALGTLLGALTAKPSYHQHKHDHQMNGGCSHGYIEDITEVRLPRQLESTAAFAVLAVHIDHHADVFVPIVGVTLGMWAGNLAAPLLSEGYKKITALF